LIDLYNNTVPKSLLVELILAMADVATPSGAAMFDAGGASEKKPAITKPEKPDEEAYKANLKKAEKEHTDVMTKLVSQLEPSHGHRLPADTFAN